VEKILPDPLPEIIYASSDSQISRAIQAKLKAGQLVKLGSRLYSSNMVDSPEAIIARNLYGILGKLFPGAVISHRSALEGGPSSDGIIFLSYKYTKKLMLPGLTVRLIKGASSAPGDTPFMGKLFLASRPRAFLENLQPSRGTKASKKVLELDEIKKRLEAILRIHGVDEINKLRDEARSLSSSLGLEEESKRLEKIIGALLGTKQSNILQTKVAKARAKGEPFDPHRIEVFSKLIAWLKTIPLTRRAKSLNSEQAENNFAFFESYFSNFIEGTEFDIEEAAEIIFQNKVMPNRPEDSHDILGTFRIVSNKKEMNIVPTTPEELLEIMQRRHTIIMEGRPNKNPGVFKEIANRAGQTIFVQPELVRGTIIQAFKLYEGCDPGLAKAMFMMFLVAEIHPFDDGNGRLARIMMNAELENVNQNRIIIPTVYREDYLMALRHLSRAGEPEAYVRMLDRAQKFSSLINFENYDNALEVLKQCNAFSASIELILRMPQSE